MDKKYFRPVQRQAVDGETWWVVYDVEQKKFSTLTCFGKYRTKKACLADIAYCYQNLPKFAWREI